MREGDSASYGSIMHRTLGHTRITFECLEYRSFVNGIDEPVRQWLFKVSYDAGEFPDETVENYICVSIADQTARRCPMPFDDWDTCYGVVVKQTDSLDDDADVPMGSFRDGDYIADYSAERANITAALMRVLEEAYLLNPTGPVEPVEPTQQIESDD